MSVGATSTDRLINGYSSFKKLSSVILIISVSSSVIKSLMDLQIKKTHKKKLSTLIRQYFQRLI